MKLFLKRAGFLLLMLVLGELCLVLLLRGYPFAWHVTVDYQDYWMPLALGLDTLCIFAALALILWSFRGFLFGRGRPWLAWLSGGLYVLLWAASIWTNIRDSEAHWNINLVVGNEALIQKVTAMEQQPWSPADIRDLPPQQRQEVCSKAVMEQEAHALGKREGFPMHLHFPADMAAKGLFDSDACPAELVQKFRKLTSLDAQIEAAIGSQASFEPAFDQLALHPDTQVWMSEQRGKQAAETVDGAIALKELQWRMVSNGQMQDHTWEELPGPGHVPEVLMTFFNPRIWQDKEADSEDAWNFWLRLELADGRSDLLLVTDDCTKRTETVKLLISRPASGKVRMDWIGGGTNRISTGSSGERWLQRVCASKGKQALLPELRQPPKP